MYWDCTLLRRPNNGVSVAARLAGVEKISSSSRGRFMMRPGIWLGVMYGVMEARGSSPEAVVGVPWPLSLEAGVAGGGMLSDLICCICFATACGVAMSTLLAYLKSQRCFTDRPDTLTFSSIITRGSKSCSIMA